MQGEREFSLNEEKKGKFSSIESIIRSEVRCHRDFVMVLHKDLSFERRVIGMLEWEGLCSMKTRSAYERISLMNMSDTIEDVLLIIALVHSFALWCIS